MNDDDHIKDLIETEGYRNDTINQFGVAQVPYHTSNGTDSPQTDFAYVTNRSELLRVVVQGTSAQTAANYGVFFIAPYKCTVSSIVEVHATAETTATTCTLQLEKLTGIVASGSGTNLLINTFNLKAAANTVQTGQFAQLSKPTFALAKGDRLGLVFASTGSSPANISQVVVVVQLRY